MKKIIAFLLVFVALFIFTSYVYAKPAVKKQPVKNQSVKTQISKKQPVMNNAQWSKVVVLETNRGDIEIKLFGEVAPKTCENFVRLIRKGYYDGIIFHRVIKAFMIQGGDPTGTGMGGESIWGNAFEDEFDQNVGFNSEGILAMANAGPNTNGSQFFITTSVPHTQHLHMRHTVFGKVIKGMDVVKAIENSRTDRMDKPLEKQYIIRAYVKDSVEQPVTHKTTLKK